MVPSLEAGGPAREALVQSVWHGARHPHDVRAPQVILIAAKAKNHRLHPPIKVSTQSLAPSHAEGLKLSYSCLEDSHKLF